MGGRRAALLAALLFVVAAKPALALDLIDPCGAETRRVERAMRLPDGLLTAISIVESGRYDKASRASLAWPWTVTAEGKGRFLPSKAAAIAEVMALQGRGVRNIDVGCMQINLQAHKNAFPDLNTAFDPRANIAYAATFLTNLHEETGSWATAGTHYHSRTPHLAARYRVKLALAWNKMQTGDENPQPVRVAAGARAPGQIAGAGADRLAQPVVYRPLPQAVQAGEKRQAEQAQKQAALEAQRLDAKRAADAWRQEKLAAYHLRKLNAGGIPVRP